MTQLDRELVVEAVEYLDYLNQMRRSVYEEFLQITRRIVEQESWIEKKLAVDLKKTTSFIDKEMEITSSTHMI